MDLRSAFVPSSSWRYRSRTWSWNSESMPYSGAPGREAVMLTNFSKASGAVTCCSTASSPGSVKPILFLFTILMVVRFPTCCSKPRVTPRLNRITASWALISSPLLYRRRLPPLPTTAQDSNFHRRPTSSSGSSLSSLRHVWPRAWFQSLAYSLELGLPISFTSGGGHTRSCGESTFGTKKAPRLARFAFVIVRVTYSDSGRAWTPATGLSQSCSAAQEAACAGCTASPAVRFSCVWTLPPAT
mmetsp:Transcript_10668/g.30332  ORF Transcript_10668/g.30332 Transcript_10668/m.30332 type:complete len:243 (+) Transcript_10668:1279-2007(+)